jgi:hypothetical protein
MTMIGERAELYRSKRGWWRVRVRCNYLVQGNYWRWFSLKTKDKEEAAQRVSRYWALVDNHVNDVDAAYEAVHGVSPWTMAKE